jgi:hypothetical protein
MIDSVVAFCCFPAAVTISFAKGTSKQDLYSMVWVGYLAAAPTGD